MKPGAGVEVRGREATLDLSWITDTLAVGGSVPPTRCAALAREHQVAAVVDVRGESCDDMQLFAQHHIELLHLPTIDFAAIRPALLDRGVAFVSAHLAAGRRVLVHCAHGIGRSPLLALCVLVERGLAPMEALALTKRRRACVSPSPAQYRAWAEWLAARRRDRGSVWSVPTFDEFKATAYRHAR